MKTQIVVQHRRTKAYLRDDNKWTGSVLFARLFETPYHALHCCVDKDIEETDIMFRFPDQREVRFLRC